MLLDTVKMCISTWKDTTLDLSDYRRVHRTINPCSHESILLGPCQNPKAERAQTTRMRLLNISVLVDVSLGCQDNNGVISTTAKMETRRIDSMRMANDSKGRSGMLHSPRPACSGKRQGMKRWVSLRQWLKRNSSSSLTSEYLGRNEHELLRRKA